MPPTLARALALVASLTLAATLIAGCSKGSDPAPPAQRTQAVERLVAYGLPKDQATCIVDKLGAETVTAVGDLDALVASNQYRDAARTCIPDG